MNFDFTQMRLESVDIRLYQFISANLIKWVNETIISDIWDEARAVGLNENVTQQVMAVRTGDIAFDVVFEYKVDGKPVGMWLNNGRGEVKPIHAKALMIPLKDGTTIFRKKAKAFPGYHFMEKGFQTGYSKLLQLIQNETQAFYEDTRLR